MPRLKTNLAILVLGDAAGKLVNFLAFSRLARVLEPESNAQFEFAFGVIVIGTLLIEAGLGPWGARAVARDPGAAGRVLGRVVALRALILAAVLAALGAFAGTVSFLGDGGRASLLAIAALMLVPKPFLREWLFQGRNEMATVTLTMLLEPLVTLAGTVLFVREPAHLTRAPLVLAAATASVALAQAAVSRARGVRAELRHGLENAGATLRESLPLGLSTLAWAIRFFAPMLALGWFRPGADAGAFGASHRLAVSMHAVVWLWFFNLLPLWSSLFATAPAALSRVVRRALPITVLLAALLVAAVAFAAPVMTVPALWGARYGLSVDLLRWFALVPALAWISGNFRFGLIARGAIRSELAANAVAAACAVLALAILLATSRLDVWTATAVFVGAEAVTLVVAWLLWRRKRPQTADPPTR